MGLQRLSVEFFFGFGYGMVHGLGWVFFGVYAMTLILFSGTQYKMHGTCFWDCPASRFSHAPNVAYFSCSFVQFSWLGTRRSPSLKFLSASYFLAFQLSIPVSFFCFLGISHVLGGLSVAQSIGSGLIDFLVLQRGFFFDSPPFHVSLGMFLSPFYW